MLTIRKSEISTLDTKYFALSPGLKLHMTPDFGYFVLERSVKTDNNLQKSPAFMVNHTAMHLMALADGTHTIAEAVEMCQSKLGDPEDGFAIKLVKFMEQACKCGQLSLSDTPKPVPLEITGSADLWFPLHAMIELTTNCNLKCLHCYRFPAETSNVPKPETIKAEDCLTIIESMYDNGLVTIEFSGGEPLLYPGIMNLVERSVELFQMVSIVTNGTLITDESCNRFAKLSDTLKFSISLDGSTEQIHDKMRGVKGAFKATTHAISSLTSHGITVRVGMTLTDDNIYDFENTILLAKELGCSSFAFGPVFPFGRGAKYNQSLLSKEETLKRGEYILGISEKYADFVSFVKEGSVKMFKLVGNCGAGHRSITIAPNGDVRPCPTMPTVGPVLGNLINDKYEDILRNPLIRTLRKLQSPKEEVCGSCNRLGFCKACILRGLYSFVNFNSGCIWARAHDVSKWLDVSPFKDPYANLDESPSWTPDLIKGVCGE